MKATHDLDAAVLDLKRAAEELTRNPSFEKLAHFCLLNRIAWHECHDCSLMEGKFSASHLQQFRDITAAPETEIAIVKAIACSPDDKRELARHYHENIARRLGFACKAAEGGIVAVYVAQRGEAIREVRGATRLRIERALLVSELPIGVDLTNKLQFAELAYSWLRHRLVLQFTELLFERGPYGAALDSHIKIAESISRCFQILLGMIHDTSGQPRTLEPFLAELPAYLSRFDTTIYGALLGAKRVVVDGASVDDVETLARGHITEAIFQVGEFLISLRETSDQVACYALSGQKAGAAGVASRETRVLLYKRGERFYAHCIDDDIVAFDASGFDQALSSLEKLRILESRMLKSRSAIAGPRRVPPNLLARWERASMLSGKAESLAAVSPKLNLRLEQ